MLRPRIIPCLLLDGRGLVKTVQFGTPKYVGDPINAIKIFNEKQADELMLLDIRATTSRTAPDYQLIADCANECRMPLCYGGGVHTVAQARQIVGLGVEKVALSSAAIRTPELIGAIADQLGRQSVVVVLDVRRTANGYTVWTHNGTVDTGFEPKQLAIECATRGAGEIVVNSIDRDGVMAGYDVELATAIHGICPVPMTVLGGAGSIGDLGELASACGPIGLAAGSLFVFKGSRRAVLINYPSRSDRVVISERALNRAQPAARS